MKEKSKMFLLAGGMLALFILTYLGYQVLSQKGNQGVSESKKIAPPFTVKSMKDGKLVSLADQKGKNVVLNFWASWCPPCRDEMPHFDKVAKELATNNSITFMMVDITDGVRETEDKAAKYIKDNGFSFNVYFDITAKAANDYGIRSIPSTYFIDTNGSIQNTKIGSMKEAELRSAVATLLQ